MRRCRRLNSASVPLSNGCELGSARPSRNGMSEVTRRLETDAKAVTILTVHRSKGLEFPIVYLPDAWDRHANGSDEGRILRLHEPTARSSGECVLDVGGRNGPGRPERFSRYREEEAGEDLRLLYVALTRARSQVVTWWAPSYNTPGSALQRFASRRPGDPPHSESDLSAGRRSL